MKHTVVKHVRTLQYACSPVNPVIRIGLPMKSQWYEISSCMGKCSYQAPGRYIALFPDIYIVAFSLNNILNETGN